MVMMLMMLLWLLWVVVLLRTSPAVARMSRGGFGKVCGVCNGVTGDIRALGYGPLKHDDDYLLCVCVYTKETCVSDQLPFGIAMIVDDGYQHFRLTMITYVV